MRERDRILTAAQRLARQQERALPREWVRIMAGVQVLTYFETLCLPCSLIPERDKNLWRTIWSTDKGVVALEILHGGQAARSQYNYRSLSRVFRSKRPLVGTHGGFYDLFVPILEGRSVAGYLANGPFGRRPLSASDIAREWTKMTGRPALAGDPELLRYAAVALDVPVLAPGTLRSHTSYMVELGKALSGSVELSVLRDRQRKLDRRVRRARANTAMWELSRGLTDPAVHGFWSADFRNWHRNAMGVGRLPNTVVAIARRGDGDQDPLQALVAARRFSEQCSKVALGFSDTICGRAGETTAFLLTHVDPALPPRRARQAIVRWLERVRSKLGRMNRASVRFGVAQAPDPKELPRCLNEALTALEWATHENRPQTFYVDESRRRAESRPTIFRSLADVVTALRQGASSDDVRISVERLLSEVVWRSSTSVSAARAYVEVLFAELVHFACDDAVLEAKVTADHVLAFHAAIDGATTVRVVTQAFREHVMVLHDALLHPERAERRAKLARALRYIESHLTDALALADVARVAGYAPDYFSRLLREHYGETFEGWLLARRLDRAKHLLRTTELEVGRVSSESGFGAAGYFYRVFRRATGETPSQFRRQGSKA